MRENDFNSTSTKFSPQQLEKIKEIALERGLSSSSSSSEAEDDSIKFSIFFFAADGIKNKSESYDLILESAKFADRNGFHAVWSPERHFYKFGGLYPNPAILSSALSTITNKINLRAGSVVLPLHNPIKVAEDWSMLDNLSNGRIGLSFASGWHPDDFILSNTKFEDRKDVLYKNIDLLNEIWSKGRYEDNERSLEIYPKPVQEKIPLWITTSGNPNTWMKAGELGANVLTGLLGNDIKELERNIVLYKEYLQKYNHDVNSVEITVMLHTFIGEDMEDVHKKVSEPFINYLKIHMDQYKSSLLSKEMDLDTSQFTEDDKEALARYAYDRYIGESALIGTIPKCINLVESLKSVGVTEVASLIDFGVEKDDVLDSLKYIVDLKEIVNGREVLS